MATSLRSTPWQLFLWGVRLRNMSYELVDSKGMLRSPVDTLHKTFIVKEVSPAC